MNNYKNKLITALCFLLFATHASAATTTSSLTATATITPGCVFNNPSYNAYLGTIKTGQVGEGAMTITVTCTNNMAYTIQPQVDSVTYQGAEPIIVRLYKDSSRRIPFTTSSTLSYTMASGRNDGSHVIYIKANGAEGKPDLGKGPVLSTPQSFNVAYPILITF